MATGTNGIITNEEFGDLVNETYSPGMMCLTRETLSTYTSSKKGIHINGVYDDTQLVKYSDVQVDYLYLTAHTTVDSSKNLAYIDVSTNRLLDVAWNGIVIVYQLYETELDFTNNTPTSAFSISGISLAVNSSQVNLTRDLSTYSGKFYRSSHITGAPYSGNYFYDTRKNVLIGNGSI